MARLRVAAVQVTSENGQMERNLANAAAYVAQAAAAGAELILCPELLAAGYIFDPSIWRAGEPRGGMTESWLKEQAREHRVHVGATYLEAEGEEFYNTFALAGPDGEIVGRARKGSLPFFEGWYFAPCDRPKLIETVLGKLGVGICADNSTAGFLNQMLEARPDLVLMPHSAPTPTLGPVARVFDRYLSEISSNLARALAAPTVMANKVALEPSRTPLPNLPGLEVKWRFRGFSSVSDGEGNLLGSLVDREGVVVAEVEVGGARSPRATARPGFWSFEPSKMAGPTAVVMRVMTRLARLAYGASRQRRRMARRIGGGES